MTSSPTPHKDRWRGPDTHTTTTTDLDDDMTTVVTIVTTMTIGPDTPPRRTIWTRQQRQPRALACALPVCLHDDMMTVPMCTYLP